MKYKGYSVFARHVEEVLYQHPQIEAAGVVGVPEPSVGHEDIDKALKFGLGHPMGPFELGDFVGLEIGLAVAETLWENFKDPKWRPALSLRKLVASGDLGRKTGRGWYDYTSGEKKPRTDIHL